MKLQNAIRRFLEYSEVEKNQSIKTIENYNHYLGRFLEFANNINVNKITLDLVHNFNRFYENNRVLNAEKKEKDARLLLVSAYVNVLKSCLYILAIPEVDQM